VLPCDSTEEEDDFWKKRRPENVDQEGGKTRSGEKGTHSLPARGPLWGRGPAALVQNGNTVLRRSPWTGPIELLERLVPEKL